MACAVSAEMVAGSYPGVAIVPHSKFVSNYSKSELFACLNVKGYGFIEELVVSFLRCLLKN